MANSVWTVTYSEKTDEGLTSDVEVFATWKLAAKQYRKNLELSRRLAMDDDDIQELIDAGLGDIKKGEGAVCSFEIESEYVVNYYLFRLEKNIIKTRE